MQNPVFVVCDRCRAEGLAGEDPFAAFGALLEFEPVPRRSNRADGWDAEVQRAFIAALSLTGSERAACRAVGKSAFGVTQLLAHEGSEGFRAAHEQAMAMAADERSRRLAEGVRAVAREQYGRRPADPPWANARRRGRPPGRSRFAAAAPYHDEDPDQEPTAASERARADLLRVLAGRYLMKLEQERDARISGRVVEADFYLRQITMLEVSIDVVGGDGMAILHGARKDGYELIDIAETEMSKLLDEARRGHWQACGDPPRPEHPPSHLLARHDGFSTEPLDCTHGGRELTHDQQRRALQERHRQAAADQVEWEAEARRDHERRREATPLKGEGEHRSTAGGSARSGGGSAGQPAATADGTDVTNSRQSTESKAEDAQQRSDLVERCEAAADVRSESDTIDAANLLRGGPHAPGEDQ